MKLVILDRDGVINQDSDYYIKSVDEFQFIEGSVEAIAKLSKKGFTVVVATNQSGLARGLFQESDLTAMHTKLNDSVEKAGGKISGIFFCPHGPDDRCDCRKPLPGLIDQIENTFSTSAKGWPIIGDSLRDLEAGIAKNCDPILVKTGKGEKTIAKLEVLHVKVKVFENLAEATDYILQSY